MLQTRNSKGRRQVHSASASDTRQPPHKSPSHLQFEEEATPYLGQPSYQELKRVYLQFYGRRTEGWTARDWLLADAGARGWDKIYNIDQLNHLQTQYPEPLSEDDIMQVTEKIMHQVPQETAEALKETATILTALVEPDSDPSDADIQFWKGILLGAIQEADGFLAKVEDQHTGRYDAIRSTLTDHPPILSSTAPNFTRPLLSPEPSESGASSTDSSPVTSSSPVTRNDDPPTPSAAPPIIINVAKPPSSRASSRSRSSHRRSVSTSGLVLVRDKRSPSTARVMSRPTTPTWESRSRLSPPHRPATPSRLSHVSRTNSPERGTVIKRTKTTVLDPNGLTATTHRTESWGPSQFSTSHATHRHAKAVDPHGSNGSESKSTHLKQTITSAGKKRTEFFL